MPYSLVLRGISMDRRLEDKVAIITGEAIAHKEPQRRCVTLLSTDYKTCLQGVPLLPPISIIFRRFGI